VGARRLGLVAAAGLALVAGTAAAGSWSSPGGLFGTLRRGPVTPVCVVERPCYVPVTGATLVFTRGATSARVVTDRAGRYRIGLRPGTYSVRVLLRGSTRRVQPSSARVRGGFTRAGFVIDTGIR
jgi:Carboxypeptidase regulatory-like domain